VLGAGTENLETSSRAFFWGALFVVVVVAISPNLAWLAVDSPPKRLVAEILLPALAAVGLLLSVVGRLWIGVLLLLPWVALAPFEAYYILDFGRPSDTHLLGVIADSDVAEARHLPVRDRRRPRSAEPWRGGRSGGICLAARAGAGESPGWGAPAGGRCCASALALALPQLVDLDGPPHSLPIENLQASMLDPNDNLAKDFRRRSSTTCCQSILSAFPAASMPIWSSAGR
jgi:hypothetical protein